MARPQQWIPTRMRAAAPAAGAPTVPAPHDSGNNNRNAVVRDPDGTLVELVAKRS